jgi:putative alpha-1,2-mannosidase
MAIVVMRIIVRLQPGMSSRRWVSEGKGCYVDEMLLNGKSYQHNYLDMRSLMQGTQIIYRLSEQPNLQRGTEEDDAPYSFSRK